MMNRQTHRLGNIQLLEEEKISIFWKKTIFSSFTISLETPF